MRMSRRMALYTSSKLKLTYSTVTGSLSDIKGDELSPCNIPAGNYAVYNDVAYYGANARYNAYNASLSRQTCTSNNRTHLGYYTGIKGSYGFSFMGRDVYNDRGGSNITNEAEAISSSLTTHVLASTSNKGDSAVCTEFAGKVVVGGGGYVYNSPTLESYDNSLTKATLGIMDDKSMYSAANSALLVCYRAPKIINTFTPSGTKTVLSMASDFSYLSLDRPPISWKDYAVFPMYTSSTDLSKFAVFNTSGTVSIIDVSTVLHICLRTRLYPINDKNMGIFGLAASEGNGNSSAILPMVSSISNKLVIGEILAPSFGTAYNGIRPVVISASKTILGCLDMGSGTSKIAKFTY